MWRMMKNEDSNTDLAGTGFWKLYKSEIQGKFIDELPIGDRSDYWNRVLGQVVDKRKPYAGVTQPGTINAANYALFWVRLPISDNKKDINLILGYDHLVKISEGKARSIKVWFDDCIKKFIY
jgi:hypothetical protein